MLKFFVLGISAERRSSADISHMVLSYPSLYVLPVLFGDPSTLGSKEIFEVGLSSITGDIHQAQQHRQPLLDLLIKHTAMPRPLTAHTQHTVQQQDTLRIYKHIHVEHYNMQRKPQHLDI